MSYFEDQDIPSLFADLGVPVVISPAGAPSVTTVGIPDFVGRDALNPMGAAGVSAVTITVTVQTSQLPPDLPNATPLTVDGVAMKIRDRLPEGDGALTHLLCEVT